MSQLTPNVNAPKTSTDYIYGDRMEPYEDRMNLFLNEKEIKVDASKVDEKDIEEVSGLESIIRAFSTKPRLTMEEDSNLVIDGTEGRASSVFNTLLQLVKDAVNWLLNFINNRLARISIRAKRLSFKRKRDGLKSIPVKYPASVRRLMTPTNVGTDSNWVAMALEDVSKFYNQSIKAYKFLTDRIKNTSESIDRDIKETIKGTANCFGSTWDGNFEGYKSDLLPGNRYLIIQEVDSNNLDNIRVYFGDAALQAKLKSPDFIPTTFTTDNTLSKAESILEDIKRNQRTVSELARTFEKQTTSVLNTDIGLTPDTRKYLNWLIRFNKRLMNITVQYTVNCVDSSLDFVSVGVKDAN